MNKQIEFERNEMSEILAQNFALNDDKFDASDFEWSALCLQMAGYRKQSEGEWIKDEKSKFKHRYHCTACDFYLIGAPTKHCPNCGARMKGDKTDA